MERNGKVAEKINKSRAKYPCPAPLEKLIAEYNLEPLEDLPDFQDQLRISTHLLRDKTGNIHALVTDEEVFEKIYKRLPPKLQKHIRERAESLYEEYVYDFEDDDEDDAEGGGDSQEFYNQLDFPSCEELDKRNKEDDPWRYLSDMIAAYQDYRANKFTMLMFIQQLEKEQKEDKADSAFALLNMETPDVPVMLRFEKRADGRHYATGLLALLGTFDERRLRRCVIKNCGKVFWAKKKESATCSSRCYETFKKRRARARLKNE